MYPAVSPSSRLDATTLPLADHLCDAIAAAGAVSSHSAPWDNESGDRSKLQICKTPVQGRSHQTWSSQVRSRCVQNTARVWGHAPPETFLEFRGYDFASETIFGIIWCYSETRQQFHMYEYPPIASYSSSTSSSLHGCPPSSDAKQDTWEGKSVWREKKKGRWLWPSVNVMFAQLRVECKEV